MRTERLDPSAEKRYVGVAYIEDMGIDLERMKRYVTLWLDPPKDGERTHTAFYGAVETAEDGRIVRAPVTDVAERHLVRHVAELLGYELIGWRD